MSAIFEKNHKWAESQSHRVYPTVWNENETLEDGTTTEWVPVPPEFERDIIDNAPYLDVEFAEDGVTITKVTPRPDLIPPPEPFVYEPTVTDNLILSQIS